MPMILIFSPCRLPIFIIIMLLISSPLPLMTYFQFFEISRRRHYAASRLPLRRRC
jgi:hypothetical protein